MLCDPLLSKFVDVLINIAIALGGFWLGYTTRRPRIQISGTGSGGFTVPGHDIMVGTITFTNVPRFFGIRVRREPAEITSARLLEGKYAEHIGPQLVWRDQATGVMSTACTIQPGQQATLFLFAKERYAEDFFIFDHENVPEKPPKRLVRFKERRVEFVLRIYDKDGRKYETRVTARNSEQTVDPVTPPNRWRTRMHYLGLAVRLR